MMGSVAEHGEVETGTVSASMMDSVAGHGDAENETTNASRSASSSYLVSGCRWGFDYQPYGAEGSETASASNSYIVPGWHCGFCSRCALGAEGNEMVTLSVTATSTGKVSDCKRSSLTPTPSLKPEPDLVAWALACSPGPSASRR